MGFTGNRSYLVEMEIAGHTAKWRDLSSGDCENCQPVPSLQQAISIFEGIITLMPNAIILPTEVRICSPLVYQSITTNSHVGSRKPQSVKEGTPYQRREVVLLNPCYQLFGKCILVGTRLIDPHTGRSTNSLHCLQHKFQKRLRNGKYFHPISLGSKKLATYFGPLRPTTKVNTSINMVVRCLPLEGWDRPFNGCRVSRFANNVEIKNGVLVYPLPKWFVQ